MSQLKTRSLYSVWHKDYPQEVRTYDGKSSGDAKLSAYYNAHEAWNDVRYIDFRCRKLPVPQIMQVNASKLKLANAIVKTFISNVELAITKEGILVQWETNDSRNARIWITHGNDFYPIWYERAPWGGTCSTALSQVIRWLEGKPVLPLGSWKYWASPEIGLGRKTGELLNAVQAAGWPETINCVICGQPPKGLDWWHLDDVSGPCCSYGSCTELRKEGH